MNYEQGREMIMLLQHIKGLLEQHNNYVISPFRHLDQPPNRLPSDFSICPICGSTGPHICRGPFVQT